METETNEVIELTLNADEALAVSEALVFYINSLLNSILLTQKKNEALKAKVSVLFGVNLKINYDIFFEDGN